MLRRRCWRWPGGQSRESFHAARWPVFCAAKERNTAAARLRRDAALHRLAEERARDRRYLDGADYALYAKYTDNLTGFTTSRAIRRSSTTLHEDAAHAKAL